MLDYQALFKIMDQQYPLKTRDCGKLCNKACCSDTNKETGMILFPKEEENYLGGDWYRIKKLTKEEADIYPFDQSFVYKFICKGTCPRDERPLACRIFPTYPKLHENGVFNMVYDLQAFLMCPLAKSYSMKELDRGFVNAARKVWGILLENQELKERYKFGSKEYDETINSPWFKLILNKR